LHKETSEDLRIQYGIWLGMPPSCREIKEQKEWAKAHDIHPDTTVDWKDDPLVQKVRDSYMKFYGEKDKKDIVDNLIKLAKGSGPSAIQAIKQYMEWQGMTGDNKPAPNLSGLKVEYITKE
jgi:hypothetical protein